MSEKRILEVCVDSVESALAAEQGGADRFELCGNLIIGGTSPSPALFRAVRRETKAKIHVLLRPRFGDFLYTDREFGILQEEAESFLEWGADGIVCGCLTPQGALEESRMRRLVELAHGAGACFTLHRAFDVCRDPMETLSFCEALGVDLILTSGQKNTCLEGIPLLRELLTAAKRTEILIGAGVDAGAVLQLREELPAAKQFHMSGKTVLQSGMEYRKQGVSMGLPSLSEFELWRTEERNVRAAREALERA